MQTELGKIASMLEGEERVKTPLPHLRFGNAAVADYDNDGLVDLYLPNAGPAVPDRKTRARWIGDRTGPTGVLLRNRGGFRFGWPG